MMTRARREGLLSAMFLDQVSGARTMERETGVAGDESVNRAEEVRDNERRGEQAEGRELQSGRLEADRVERALVAAGVL